MSGTSVGTVLGIAVRPYKNGPMKELTEVAVSPAEGVVGDLDASTQRAVTFISSRQWAEVNRELGTDLPWHTRRANILVDADSLGALRKRIIQVGSVRVHVHAETRPCSLMEKFHPGLQAALDPDCRGGVYGSIVQEGTIRIGDSVNIVD